MDPDNAKDENTHPIVMSATFGAHSIRDYKIPYSLINMEIKEIHRSVFPRSGDLILNLFIGKNFGNRIANYNTPFTSTNKLYISGLFSKNSLHLEQYGSCKAYAIRVNPVIGHHLLRLPMYELLDKHVEISNILRPEGRELQKIESSESIQSLENKYLNKFLETILPSKFIFYQDPIFHAVNFIKSRHGMVTVKNLADKFCMSERTLNRQFFIKVGLSPQAYAKIIQVEYAIELINLNPVDSLDDIAFASGYYDTAHLSKDFRQRVNLSPSSFRNKISPITANYLRTQVFF